MVMVTLRSSPPPSAAAVQRWVVADRTELRPLRVSLRRALDTQSLIPGTELEDVAERMTIAATELASNALRHARCPADVTLSRTKKAFLIDVADDQPFFSSRDAGELSAGDGGRGLTIVQELADDAGWYIAGGRKHVWARFCIPRSIRRSHAPRIAVSGLHGFIRRFRRIGH
jgi:serine/threonine-protein kinase RsbW